MHAGTDIGGLSGIIPPRGSPGDMAKAGRQGLIWGHPFINTTAR